MKKRLLSIFILITCVTYGLPASSTDDWENRLKKEFVNRYIEFNPIPFKIPFKKLYPDFNRIKVAIAKDYYTWDSGFLIIYNKNNPEEYFLYSQTSELVQFLLNRYNFKITSEDDIVKYITPIVDLTEIRKNSDTEYYLFTGETFFDSRRGYILQTKTDGAIKSMVMKMELDSK